MRGKLKHHWKFTTFLFAIGLVEFIIVALYFSVNFQSPSVPKIENNSYAALGIRLAVSLPEIKQPQLGELFKENSGIEKRLPKLLHDYFKETQSATFAPAELVDLLGFELGQVKQFTLRKDAVVLHINPHQLSSDEAIKSISIKKDLLSGELKELYKTTGSDVRVAKVDYEITSQPTPGNTLNPQEKMLALTFDDGPDGNTHALLDTLDKYEATATFFVLGQKVAGGVGVLQRMVRQGHEIGNHSWSHPDLRRLTLQQITSQIADTQAAIKNATGMTPTQMRPPYGAINPAVQQGIASQGLSLAMWSVDTNDWQDRNPEVLYQRIMGSARDGGIILLHDIHLASVQAAIQAIPDLKGQGYQLVTVSQLQNHK
jgi:peptidoglycan/xylan/chitin deacetylase (PgdA/CDA1 family)